MDDLISRQAAIDALDKRFDSIPMEQTAEILQLRKDLRELPSAQPERLTDAEQRIFIEAMWREKSVCMAVDKEFPDAKVNLTDVCREIVRKVKGALWE